MKNIKQNISENLVRLRKEKKLTQQDLAKHLNYSDKAISRWEKGECLPNVDTLEQICDFYGVDFSWLVAKNDPDEKIKLSNLSHGYKITILLLLVASCYTLSTIAFIYYRLISNASVWQFFVWATPTSFAIVFYYSKSFLSKFVRYILLSLTMWTLLASLYLQFIALNIWPIFLLGIPIQIIIFLTYIMNQYKKR